MCLLTIQSVKRSYDSTLIKYSQVNAQAQTYKQKIEELHDRINSLQKENKSLKLSLKRIKKQSEQLSSPEQKTSVEKEKVELKTEDTPKVESSNQKEDNVLNAPPFEYVPTLPVSILKQFQPFHSLLDLSSFVF